jgi:hypothetical protein
MMMTRTYKEHSTKWLPCATMYTVVCLLGRTLSNPNIFEGRLGRQVAIDSQNIRQ